jgi:glycosyltransferase involved in cell wall biosynthesis
MYYNSISFIIPCYNEEKNILKCILSIKEQAKDIPGNYEIIVVDNNSTDNTAEIARSENVIVVKEHQKGVVFARQKGLETSRYQLIANIDADSKLGPNWVKNALEEINHNGVVVVTGPLIYSDGSFILRTIVRFYYYTAMFANKYIGVFLQGGNCIIKKMYLDSIRGYDTSVKFYGEDTMTAKRLKKFGKIKFSLKLNLYSSARRLQNQGVFKTSWLYFINYLYVTFKNKPLTEEYKDFR